MGLPETYREVRKSIVAFIPKYLKKKSPSEPEPLFPPIIGTGFIVDSNGIIATNDHIVKIFPRLFKPPNVSERDWGAVAMLFHQMELGIIEIPLEIIGLSRIGHFSPKDVYYGPPKPDVALVLVNALSLPPLVLSEGPPVVDGERIATAGFPMGTDSLMAPGWLHQIAPTLQEGIVSSVLPFPCPGSHGFAINVMTQGGASGSPVFRPNDGKVIGVLYGGLFDKTESAHGDYFMSPTNISYVVPSHYLIKSLAQARIAPDFKPNSDAKPIDEMIKSMPLKERPRIRWKDKK